MGINPVPSPTLGLVGTFDHQIYAIRNDQVSIIGKFVKILDE